jgi:hypothetical protein
MGFLSKLFGVGAEKTIISLGDVADRLFTSKDEKLTHEEVRMRILNTPSLAQIGLNKQEAAHRTIFVAGWRPFIGWVCGIALLYNFILRDIFAWVIRLHDAAIEPPPELAMEHLMTVLLGMLGLGGMRTYEKLKNKTV